MKLILEVQQYKEEKQIVWLELAKPNLTTNKLQHKTINTYKTKPNECRTWFRNLLHHWTTKWNGPILQLPGRAQKYLN